MAHEIKPQLRSLMLGGRHCWSTLWKIERSDGMIFRFTDHDQSIELDGQAYTPAGSTTTASARQHTDGTSPQNLDVRGTIVDDSITEEDLQIGKFRRARVTEILVDWRFPWAGSFIQNVYFIEKTTFSADTWVAKMLGLIVQLRPSKGITLERACQYRLGDERCGVDLAPFTQTGKEVTVVTDDHRIFSTDTTGADGYLDNGRLTWTTGDNVGSEAQVKSYLDVGGVVELQLETPYSIQVGDEFTVVAGCDYLFLTCKNKFNNVLRHGGFPDVPGNDRLFQRANPPQ